MFLVTRPRSFWLKIEKKKKNPSNSLLFQLTKKNHVKIKLKLFVQRRDRRQGRDTCMLHLQTRSLVDVVFTVNCEEEE